MVDLYIAIAAVFVVAVVGGLFYVVSRRRRGQPERPASSRTGSGTAPTPSPGPASAPGTSEPAPSEPVPSEPVPSPSTAVARPTPGVAAAGASLRERLGRPRGLFGGIRGLRNRSIDATTWDTLEETLLRADVGVATVDEIVGDLRRRARAREISNGEDLLDALRDRLVSLLSSDVAPEGRGLRLDEEDGVVNVWLFVGVNGVGKTTTVGKVAMREAGEGRRVLLAAGDTFRAAASEQLATWAERAGADIVRGAEGGDPSAVVFDAVQRAGARGVPLVLADTAGRLHTKVNLVEELKKIRRVADRPPGRVTEVLLVLDATTGQNGLEQARQFTDAVAVTGVVLTKLDGTAKGGIVVAIHEQLGLPVKLVGVGESVEDLMEFVPSDFVRALLA